MEKDFLKKNSIIKIQKVFRGFLTRKSLRNQKKIKKARKRNNLIRELIETEKSYLFYLKQTNDYFLSPLLRKKILDEEQCQLLFSNINSIFVLNYQLYEDLKSRQYDAKIHYYGDIFLNFIPYLKIYSEYVNNYPKSIDILKKARKKNKFSKFIKKVEELPQLNRLELESLLIAPIQRLPRYVLFIEEIVKNTSKNHPDFKYFQQALVKIKEVADQVNIKKREQENLEQLLEIRPFIRGFEVVSKNRKIIKQGDIIISYKNNQRQKRKCLLFNDCLIIMQRNWDHNFTFEIKVSFEQIQIIGNEDKSLILVNGANKIWMFFPDMKTKNGWESAIKETLINFQKSKLGYGSIPPKMMNHRACIVDDSIYVFGGENSHHEKMNDLFRYQLDSYEWNLIEIKEGNKPSKRIGHTLNKIQDNLFLFGGEGKENKSLGDLHIFRIETKKWINSPKAIGVAASERSFHSSSVLSGKIWIFGGIGKTKEKLNDLHQLDTTVNPLTWINVDISNPFFAIPRCGHSTVFLDNKLFIIGGEIEKEIKQSLIIYDLKSNSFFKIENEFLERSYHTITLIKDRIWIIGGENEQLKVVNIVVLNGKNFGMKEINEIGDFPGEFSRHTTVIKENSETQKLYLFGGLEKGSGKMSNKVYCLDAHFQTLIPNENTNLEEKVENFRIKIDFF
ncbi:faciogenital dysplasia protein [Anaeramoeba ignava]|uniref:Faciogenital dysplasia protein n=1 Tax=Anaeramoeba ignava TaxID=1746090 RepID=A0A9Q0LKP7_ANAIG|nr:faciogenital dysplasia protein [Anaeramoeba ignava]